MFFARYIVSGTFNTGLTYLLYLGLLQIISYRLAYTASFALGILVSYGLNAIFVFKAKTTIGSFLKYGAIYLGQYILGLGLIILFIEYFGVPKLIAPIFSMLITVPLLFVLSNLLFTVKKKGLDNVSE